MRVGNRGQGWVLLACLSAACTVEPSPGGELPDASQLDASQLDASQLDASQGAHSASVMPSASSDSASVDSGLTSGSASVDAGLTDSSATAVESQVTLDASAGADGSTPTSASSTAPPSASSAQLVIDLDAGVADAADGAASDGAVRADAGVSDAGQVRLDASALADASNAPSATPPDASPSTDVDAALPDAGVETIPHCPEEWTCDPAWQIEVPAESIVDLATAADGSVYLLGSEAGDVYVRKLGADLLPLWTQWIDSSGHGSAASIAVDAAGDIYAAGNATVSLDESSGHSGAFVRKFDAAGNSIWTYQFLTTEAASASSLAVTPLGEVYVAGKTTGTLQAAAYVSDAFVRKLDANGLPLWVYQVNYTNSVYQELSLESATGVTADEAGVTLAGLYTDNGDAHKDAFVHQLDAQGSVVWTKELTSTAGITIDDLASDADGNLYLASTHRSYFFVGTGVTTDAVARKWDSLGNSLWARTVGTSRTWPAPPPGFPESKTGHSADGIAVDALGNVAFAGLRARTSGWGDEGSITLLVSAALTYAFDSAGQVLSSVTLPEGTSTAIAVAASGDAITAGTIAGHSYLLRTPIP